MSKRAKAANRERSAKKEETGEYQSFTGKGCPHEQDPKVFADE
jgi:hypothetical protein